MSTHYIWPIASPSKWNMDEAILLELKNAIKKVKIRSSMILREGHLIFEYHKNNKVKDSLLKVNSCTKSVVSALIGIAIDKGFIEGVGQHVDAYFPELFKKQSDIRKKQLTIEHLLRERIGQNLGSGTILHRWYSVTML